MNQHYKKLGFKTPKNYFQKSKDQILTTKINYRTKKFEYQPTFQLLIAAFDAGLYVFVCRISDNARRGPGC